MIDLTNKPEGATHYAINEFSGRRCWYRICGDHYDYCYPDDACMGLWSGFCKGRPLQDVVKIDNWSIYSNDKPLSELSDEQRGLLFNHHCNGGQLQNSQHGGSEIDVFYDTDSWSIWSLNTIYRAKQKSERELFVDAAFNTCPVFTDTKYDHEQLLNSMFDAGFKAPKVGE